MENHIERLLDDEIDSWPSIKILGDGRRSVFRLAHGLDYRPGAVIRPGVSGLVTVSSEEDVLTVTFDPPPFFGEVYKVCLTPPPKFDPNKVSRLWTYEERLHLIVILASRNPVHLPTHFERMRFVASESAEFLEANRAQILEGLAVH